MMKMSFFPLSHSLFSRELFSHAELSRKIEEQQEKYQTFSLTRIFPFVALCGFCRFCACICDFSATEKQHRRWVWKFSERARKCWRRWKNDDKFSFSRTRKTNRSNANAMGKFVISEDGGFRGCTNDVIKYPPEKMLSQKLKEKAFTWCYLHFISSFQKEKWEILWTLMDHLPPGTRMKLFTWLN